MLVANRPNEAAMHTLPTAMIQLLAPFALLFSEHVWRYAQVLLAGTILAPGKRTVGAALRVMGFLGRTPSSTSATIVSSTVRCGRAGKRAEYSWDCS